MLATHWLRRLNPAFRDLAVNTAGNVLPLVAVGTIVLAGLVGGGVDMAQAYKAERRLQAACDAGVLAGRRAVGDDGFDAAAEAQADAYFEVNFDEEEQRTSDPVFTPTSPDDGNTINGEASATIDTIIMGVFGFDTMNISVSCAASMGVGNSDIMFVLDNTASMNWAPDEDDYPDEAGEVSRITGLRAAMKSFHDTVVASTSGSNARIRYGFVPYATTVNVGSLLRAENPAWIADEITVPSVKLVRWKTGTNEYVQQWSDPSVTYTDWQQYENWSNQGSRYGSNNACSNALAGYTSPSATTNQGGIVTNTTTYSVITNDYTPAGASQQAMGGNRLVTYGQRQEQRRYEYRCNSRYIQRRTMRRYEQTILYQEREALTSGSPNTVDGVTHNNTFHDAVRQNRTFSTATYKTGASTSIPVGITTSSTLASKYNTTTTWPGCIVERQTVADTTFTFQSLALGISPAGALDLDIDSEPTADLATQWKPLWPQVAYVRESGYEYEGIADEDGNISRTNINNAVADAYCPKAAQLFTTMTEQEFDNYVDTMSVNNYGTYHDTGILWGARLSSPTGIFADNVNAASSNGGTVSRHLIFMTDGTMAPVGETNTMYGIEQVEQRITGTWAGTTDQGNRHTARVGAICEAIKARGIRVWVIGFGSSLNDTLKGCASTDSWFESYDSEDLADIFTEIANQVGELRVIQ